MACGSCGRRKEYSLNNDNLASAIVFGNNIYLTNRQLNARLENYKRNYCKECLERYTCDLTRFVGCKGIKNKI